MCSAQLLLSPKDLAARDHARCDLFTGAGIYIYTLYVLRTTCMIEQHGTPDIDVRSLPRPMLCRLACPKKIVHLIASKSTSTVCYRYIYIYMFAHLLACIHVYWYHAHACRVVELFPN